MKVAATKVLQDAKRNERPFLMGSLSSYQRRHIEGAALNTWMKLEKARAFSIALMKCKESDKRAVIAGRNCFDEICKMQNAWKSVNGIDPADCSVLSYEKRQDFKKRAGRRAYDEFWAICDHNGSSFIPQPEGFLKRTQTIRLGFVSAAKGEKGPFNKKKKIKQKEFVR